MLKSSAIAVALGIFLSVGCSSQPSDRPRDGSAPIPIGQGTTEAVETPEPGSVTDVSIRFIDEDGATATPPPTAAPSAEPSVTPNLSGPIPPQAAASPGPLEGRTPGWRIAGTDRQGVRLRESPSAQSNTVGSVIEGAIVDPVEGPVTSDGGSWIRVQAGGRQGWVPDRYLEPPAIAAAPAPSAAASPGVPTGFVIGRTDGAGANVRESPSTSAPVLGNLREGSMVQPIEGPVPVDGRAWQKVQGNGLEGWVLAVVVTPR
jgi:uncharacterized protein YraI